jgi:Protein of unknown function (DUF3592)/Short C-terminal domain
MRYWLLALGGLAVAGASIVALNWGVVHVMHDGTCASGGAYVSARPCPPGTAGHILAIVFGSFTAFAGIGLWAARGAGGRKSPIGLGTILWALLFLTLAASVALAAFGPTQAGDSGGRIAAITIGVIFVPMGLAPLLAAPVIRARKERARELVEHGKRCPGTVVSVDDTGITINNNPRVRITVRAEPPGEPPFTIEKTSTVSRVNVPRQGERCTVYYDPADREARNGISFDAAPARAASAWTAPMPGPQPAAADAPASAPEEDDDPIRQIERLAALRDKGIVSEYEFQEQKRRLLGEL